MNPVDIIAKKRTGLKLNDEEIRSFVRGCTDGSFRDYQLSAMLMAICINGMDEEETVRLTMEMADSGDRLDLSPIDGVKVDKHSTGGVADTTTLVLAPLLAACGLKVAKMSGRGLGHTGGTLDKLESIPGLTTQLTPERFFRQVNEIGVAIAGQTRSLAPADKKLYALRDVTATLDSMPLIVSSILSKKIAAGCDVVMLDVKMGSGAVLRGEDEATQLAKELVRIGNMTGRKFSALVTDMNQPLGLNVGNANEVEEAVRTLSGEAEGRLLDVTLALGAGLLEKTGLAASAEEAKAMLRRKIENGDGLHVFAEMIGRQGGDPLVVKDVRRLPQPAHREAFCAEASGYLHSTHCAMIGDAARALGAGRMHAEDTIDPAAGLVIGKRIGDRVDKGDTLCEICYGNGADTERAKELLKEAFVIGDGPAQSPVLIRGSV